MMSTRVAFSSLVHERMSKVASTGGARISHRVVTHNHRRDFESLLADARRHFETLARTPLALLRHVGSPFAPDKRPPQSPALAA